MRVPVVHAAVAYDCEYTGETYILVIYNALYIRSMEVNLVPPFMMRLASLEVNECPKFLSQNPSEKDHSVFFPSEGIRLPFMIEGIVSYLPTRRPSNDELTQHQHLVLTPNIPTWNPHTDTYRDQENAMLNYKGEVKEAGHKKKFLIAGVNHSMMSRELEPDILGLALENQAMTISGVRSGKRKGVTPEDLAKRWNVGLELAKRTVRATTQLCVRTAEPSLNRRFNQNDRMLRYPRISTEVFMDTFFAQKKKGKSFRGFTSCQVFATPFGHVFAVPMDGQSGANIAEAMKRYFKEVGVPPDLIADGARSQVQGEARAFAQKVGCQIIELEKGTHDANRAERYIQMLKQDTKKDMVERNSPFSLWCFCIERRARIINATARDNFLLEGQCPESKMTGRPCDISNLCDYGWYEWVMYKREDVQYPIGTERLGRCLGPARHAGNAMSQYVLMENGQVLPIQTLRRLLPSELNSEEHTRMRARFDEAITKKLGDSVHPPVEEDPNAPDEFVPYEDEENGPVEMPEADDIPDYDLYIGAEVLLPQDGEHMKAARVVGRVRDDDGKVLGDHNPNPILDTRVYEVMFPDGSVQQYAANLIAEHMYSQVDEDGFRYQLMECILGHRKDGHAVECGDEWITSKNGRRTRRQTTRGWYLQIAWKDGQEQWMPLKDMKESYPVEVAEYAKANGLLQEPAFAWWAEYTLKKRDHIISKVKSRVRRKTHKYGVEVPGSVREAYEIDERNGNTLWRDAIIKEMKNNRVAFKVLDEGAKPPPGHHFLGCHMVFDVKMDFTRKARFVADGNTTPDPADSTYAGVVSRESVRIVLTYAALMGFDVMASDIQNAYLQAPTKEKYWTTCGPEFGIEEEGRTAIIVRALYGMKSSGRDFRNHLRDCMAHMGYESCKADPDLWLRKAKRSTGEYYYEYLLLYTDDAMACGENGRGQLEELDKYFPMKPGSIGPPKIYLGAKISKVQLPNGVEAYAASSSQYVQEAIKNVEAYMKKRGLALNRGGVKAPIAKDYRPELDASTPLNDSDAAYYQSLIGILRWMVEIGRIDITTEVSMMSSFVAMPREGHLQQVLQIFAYLKAHHNARIVFDPSYPTVDEDLFPKKNWESIYGEEMKEEIPPNAPEPLGMEFVIRAYVDADHAGDKLTRRSRTGFLVFLNGSPVYWMSKKQTSVETSTFGSEFVAMKQCCEYLRGLRYKLRMMGIPVNNPSFIHGDNQSVLWNTTVPDSMLKKKSNSVAYHFVREGVARDEWRTGYVKTDMNPSDLLTKALPTGENRKRKVRMVMYDIYPENLD